MNIREYLARYNHDPRTEADREQRRQDSIARDMAILEFVARCVCVTGFGFLATWALYGWACL